MFHPILRMRARMARRRSIGSRRRARSPDEIDPVRLARMEAALASMPELTREVFMLHRFDDLSYRRIALRLGIGADEVLEHMVMALKHLCAALRDDH